MVVCVLCKQPEEGGCGRGVCLLQRRKEGFLKNNITSFNIPANYNHALTALTTNLIVSIFLYIHVI